MFLLATFNWSSTIHHILSFFWFNCYCFFCKFAGLWACNPLAPKYVKESESAFQIYLSDTNEPKENKTWRFNFPFDIFLMRKQHSAMTTNFYQWLPMTTNDYQWLPMTSNDYQWPHSGTNLTTFWLHSDYIPTTFWLHFCYILTASCLHSDYIPTTFQLHSDYILTTFWPHSDIILTIFWQHSDCLLTTF